MSAMLAKAVAETLKKHPVINAAYAEGGGIKYSKDVNVAMAVAIDGGLITPTIIKAQVTAMRALLPVARVSKKQTVSIEIRLSLIVSFRIFCLGVE